ncbi:hypothetical protein GGS26DRAFT_587549 [Hypomontagnella submonticulosa]|nr:hypothetical protein GGS26DRAFT_587549 [Hypomontagnella submonticulosa]
MTPYDFISVLIPAILSVALAEAAYPFRRARRPYVNSTTTFTAAAQCVPFEDPHCCVTRPVCECLNGTFFSINTIRVNGSSSLCGPPGNVTFGQDTSSIPGWCC